MTLELDESGRVNGVRFLRTELGAPDAGGRRRPTPIPGSEFVMPADAVIMAFGFHPHRMPWLEAAGVALDSQGASKPASRAVTVTRPVRRRSLPAAMPCAAQTL